MVAVRRSSRAGFTLVELMVAIVISGILIGTIFQFLLGQGRFARYQGAREEVQQNARAALELITSDLRGVAPGGITVAGESEIVIRAPRAWGVVCGYINNDLAVIFPESPALAAGDSLAFYAGSGLWSFVAVTDETAANGQATITSCNLSNPRPALSASSAADIARVRLFRGPGIPPPTGLAPLAPATELYLFQQVSYDVHTYAANEPLPGIWIRRAAAAATPQPFAGPLPDGAGLSFRYYDAAGADITGVLVAGSTSANLVDRVDVSVRTASTARFANQPQTNAAGSTVSLRNRF
ncbi:MAG: type II secretion system protein [Gemmatimonadetes bacterium]|nr:type II secretion system protein [Gemmatimonadota bacterium]